MHYFLITIIPRPIAPIIANILNGEEGAGVLLGYGVGTFAVDVLETTVLLVVVVEIVVLVVSAW